MASAWRHHQRVLLADDTRDYLDQQILPGLRHALCTASEARPDNVIGFLAAGLTGDNPLGWRRPDDEPQTDVDKAFAAHFGGGDDEDGWLDPPARTALKSALLDVALASRVPEPLVSIGSRLEGSAEEYQHASVEGWQPAIGTQAARAPAPRLGALRRQASLGSPATQLRADEGAKITVKYQRPDTKWTEVKIPWEQWHGPAKRQFAIRRAVELSPANGFELARAANPSDPLGGPIADSLSRDRIRPGETVWLRITTAQRSAIQQPCRVGGARGRPGGGRGGRGSKQASTMDRLLAKKARQKSVRNLPAWGGANGSKAKGGGVTVKLSPGQEKTARVQEAKQNAKLRRRRCILITKITISCVFYTENHDFLTENEDVYRSEAAQRVISEDGSMTKEQSDQAKSKAREAKKRAKQLNIAGGKSGGGKKTLKQLGKKKSLKFKGKKPPPPKEAAPSTAVEVQRPDYGRPSEEDLLRQFPQFDYFDRDKDGTLQHAEIKAMMVAICIQIDGMLY